MNNVESITKYMATKLITFTPETDIRDVIKTILKHKISGAPVLDEKGALVGIISEKDCLKTVVDGPYNREPTGSGTVGDYMSTNIKTMSADTNVLEAAFEFAHAPYRRFPVIDSEGILVGQVSRRDILRAIIKMKPHIKHTPSSWKGREPMIHPSKKNYYAKND